MQPRLSSVHSFQQLGIALMSVRSRHGVEDAQRRAMRDQDVDAVRRDSDVDCGFFHPFSPEGFPSFFADRPDVKGFTHYGHQKGIAREPISLKRQKQMWNTCPKQSGFSIQKFSASIPNSSPILVLCLSRGSQEALLGRRSLLPVLRVRDG
jgi:hypothetical protein